MTRGLRAKHASIYFDEALAKSRDGGWCVEFSDGETTWRFPTFEKAVSFIGRAEKSLLPQPWDRG